MNEYAKRCHYTGLHFSGYGDGKYFLTDSDGIVIDIQWETEWIGMSAKELVKARGVATRKMKVDDSVRRKAFDQTASNFSIDKVVAAIGWNEFVRLGGEMIIQEKNIHRKLKLLNRMKGRFFFEGFYFWANTPFVVGGFVTNKEGIMMDGCQIEDFIKEVESVHGEAERTIDAKNKYVRKDYLVIDKTAYVAALHRHYFYI